MYDLLFSGYAGWFSVPAILGTFFFLLRLGLMTFGLIDLEADVDGGGVDALDTADAAEAMDAGDQFDAAHADSSDLFKYLSVQSVFAFAMGFGWGALAAYKGTGWGIPASIGVGALCGFGMVYLLTWLLSMLYGLRSDGTLHIKGAVGLEGDTYAEIPAEGAGRGQVSLVIGTRQRIYNAATGDGAAIPRGARVRVLGTKDGNTLDVTAVGGGG